MTAKERILSARILLKIKRNEDYANKIGVVGKTIKKNNYRKKGVKT